MAVGDLMGFEQSEEIWQAQRKAAAKGIPADQVFRWIKQVRFGYHLGLEEQRQLFELAFGFAPARPAKRCGECEGSGSIVVQCPQCEGRGTSGEQT